MPGLTEYGKIFRDWEGLLGAAEKRAALLPGADELKAALAGHLAKARDLKLKQEGFDGDKKETTEQLRSEVKQGRDAASMLRAFVKGRIGLRTEVLKEFGVMPTRSRKRAKSPEDLPSAIPGAPGGAPGAAPPAAHTAETTAPDKPAK
jgi:hypothetical protein